LESLKIPAKGGVEKMKKLLVAAVALMFSASAAFAAGGSYGDDPVTGTVKAAGEYVGKVVSVTIAEPAKGVTDSTVKVTDEMGNPIAVTVSSAAKITDASLNVLTLNQLKEGQTVKIKAEKKGGKEEAKSITVQ
jgi:hypothetical protein